MRKVWILFLVLCCFWIFLSWNFKILYIFLGILSCFWVAFFSRNIFIYRLSFKKFLRFAFYLPYLFYQIFLSCIDVALRVLDPRMPISPEIVVFKTRLKSETLRVIYANSITLTPGTVTVDVDEDKFMVHALDRKHAEGLLKGEMEEKIKNIGEN